MLPQRQTTSSLLVALMWPMSPAAPACAAWMWPSATMPQPIPVPTLISSRCSRLGPVHPVLAAGHDVDVVVDQHRRAVAVREPVRDREVVPAGHDRRVDRPPAVELDGPRHADPDPRTSSRERPTSSSSSTKRSATHARAVLRPERDVQVGRPLGQRRAAEVAHGDAAWVAPRSATRTTPASRLKASTVGGRPPVEAFRRPRRPAPARAVHRRAGRPSNARARSRGPARPASRPPLRGSGAGAHRRSSATTAALESSSS